MDLTVLVDQKLQRQENTAGHQDGEARAFSDGSLSLSQVKIITRDAASSTTWQFAITAPRNVEMTKRES